MYALILSDNIFTSSFMSRGLKYENVQSLPFSFHHFNLDSINLSEFDCAIIKIEEKINEKLEALSSIFNLLGDKPLYLIKPNEMSLPLENRNVIMTHNGTSIRQIAYDMKKRINGSSVQDKESIIRVADLSLNLHRRTASRFNESYSLRNKEFHLLEFLMRNTDIIFSRQKLLEQVWDRNANMFTNTIDVHINIIRRKLDHQDSSRLIETVHCHGYIMHSKPYKLN